MIFRLSTKDRALFTLLFFGGLVATLPSDTPPRLRAATVRLPDPLVMSRPESRTLPIALSSDGYTRALLDDAFACRVPRHPRRASPKCTPSGDLECRVRMPHPDEVGHLFARWRSTSTAHQWARPALVHLLLASAAEYAFLYPGERIVIGDLDAKGPRHNSHDRGVDADLYLPGVMEVENAGARQTIENYPGQPPLVVRMLRARVLTLAKILARCTDGKLRIYYNDPDVRTRFLEWFHAHRLDSPFGRPMQAHNDLHRFHFHVTIADDVPILPVPEDES